MPQPNLDRASKRANAWQEQSHFRYLDRRCLCCGDYRASIEMEMLSESAYDTEVGAPLLCTFCFDNHLEPGLIEIVSDALVDVRRPPEYYFNEYYG